MSMPKPGDFFIGVIHFFSILVPGAILVYFIYPIVIFRLWDFDLYFDLMAENRAVAWPMFLVAAYIVGHGLNAISSRQLDSWYDKRYLSKFHKEHHAAAKIINEKALSFQEKQKKIKEQILGRTLIARAYKVSSGSSEGTSLYNWCLSVIRTQNSDAAAEVDRTQADSKLFRSLVYVLAVSSVVIAVDGFGLVAVIGVGLAYFSLGRFWKLRWDATSRVYEYYLILQPHPRSDSVA